MIRLFVALSFGMFLGYNIPHCLNESVAMVESKNIIKVVGVGKNGFIPYQFNAEFDGTCIPHKKCIVTTDQNEVDNADVLWWDATFVKFDNDPHNIRKPPKKRYSQIAVLVDGEPFHRGVTVDTIDWVRKTFDATVDFRESATVRWLYARHLIDKNTLFYPPEDTGSKENVIAFVNRNCNTKSGREGYVEEIIRLGIVKVNAYGKCLHNTVPPRHHESYILDPQNKHLAEKYKLFSKAKFCITIENSIVEEYNSEKLWHGLAWGCVPIYLGARTIEQYLPAPREQMYLDIRDYDFNMTKLSLKVKYLMEHDDEYEKLLRWKFLPESQWSPGFKRWKAINTKDPLCEMCKLTNN
jgi:hypothetical protein